MAQQQQLGAQHAALSRLLQNQQGMTLSEALRQGRSTNRIGLTRSEWLASIEARIGMSEASQMPISDEEIADMQVQAEEWRLIYGQ